MIQKRGKVFIVTGEDLVKRKYIKVAELSMEATWALLSRCNFIPEHKIFHYKFITLGNTLLRLSFQAIFYVFISSTNTAMLLVRVGWCSSQWEAETPLIRGKHRFCYLTLRVWLNASKKVLLIRYWFLILTWSMKFKKQENRKVFVFTDG